MKLFGNKASRGMTAPGVATQSSVQPRQVFRSDTRWGRSVLEWPSFEAFLATPVIKSGVHSVPIGKCFGKQINYDFLLTARPGTVLLCHFHGNAPRDSGELPIFTGLGVTSAITTSQFIPSDPVLGLDDNLSLAWHFGCDGIFLQRITVSIVAKLQTILSAPRVVAWGGSGGGFAAIRVVRDIPDGIALAWNPQTDISKYVQAVVHRYLRIAFPALGIDAPLPSSRDQFPSLCTEEFCAGYSGRIIYLQESTDWHVDSHLKPFLSAFSGKTLRDLTSSSQFSGFMNNQFYLHMGHWGYGHVPPGKDVLAKALCRLSDPNVGLEQVGNLEAYA